MSYLSTSRIYLVNYLLKYYTSLGTCYSHKYFHFNPLFTSRHQYFRGKCVFFWHAFILQLCRVTSYFSESEKHCKSSENIQTCYGCISILFKYFLISNWNVLTPWKQWVQTEIRWNLKQVSLVFQLYHIGLRLLWTIKVRKDLIAAGWHRGEEEGKVVCCEKTKSYCTVA